MGSNKFRLIYFVPVRGIIHDKLGAKRQQRSLSCSQQLRFGQTITAENQSKIPRPKSALSGRLAP